MNLKAIKEKGKEAFLRNRWPSVFAAFVLSVATGGFGTYSGSAGAKDVTSELSAMPQDEQMALLAVVLGVVGLLVLISSLLSIFLFSPLQLGCMNFFRKNQMGPAQTSEILSGFQEDYMSNVATMFLMHLFLAGWFCLLIIPGFVKMYSYRFVPYIRKEHPEINPTAAITLSREMMNGHKMEAFLLDLSFIGWGFLSVITCGIVGILYAGPYYQNTCAAYYEEIRSAYLSE